LRGHVKWAGLVLFVLAGCAAPATISPSPQALRARADREVATLLQRVRTYGESELTEYLAKVALRLDAGLRITVIADPTLAAFTMPGGRVFVHTGLLSALENEAQLALILARESGRDTSRLAAREGKAPMSTVALSPVGASLLGLGLRLATAVAIDGYGSDDERAADAEALRRLPAAGYDARAGADVFRRLAADDGNRGEVAEIFFYGNQRRLNERQEAWRELLRDSLPTRGPGDLPGSGEFTERMRSLVRDNAALDARAGRFTLARRQLDRVLAADPNDAVAHCYDGELYRLQSQALDGPARSESTRRAVERYQRAVELNPRYAEPFRQLALLHYQQGESVQARAAFARYLALDADAPDARRIREYLAILGQ